MKDLQKCSICGRKNFEFLFRIRDKNLNIPGDFFLQECKNCGVLFLNPQPSTEELKKYYSSDKYYSFKEIDMDSKKTRLRIFLYNLYFNERNKNFFNKILFLPIKFMVRGTNIKKDFKLLDIGCGSGQFLYDMRKSGMEKVYGIEIGDFDKINSKRFNLNIKKTTLEKEKYPKDFFDIITINHVLEHLYNPKETLNEIKRILKERGLLILSVPNYRSLIYKIFRKNWYGLDPPRHLFNYSDKLLIDLLEINGFKIIKKRYNSRHSQFVTSLYFALGIKNPPKVVTSLLGVLFLPLTWFVNIIKYGDQIELWCIKK